MAKEQILVACPSRARLLERDTATGTLRPLRTIMEGDAPATPLSKESQDRVRRAQSPQRRRHLRFASVLANQLARSLQEEHGDRITLVSACPFLGALRMSLTPEVKAAVASTINRDLADASLAAIAIELAQYCTPGAADRSASPSEPVDQAGHG